MKDTVILLIFLLSITGLIIGVCCTSESNNDNFKHTKFERIYETNDSIITITLKNSNEIGINKNMCQLLTYVYFNF